MPQIFKRFATLVNAFLLLAILSTLNSDAESFKFFPSDIVKKINELLCNQTIIGASRLNVDVDLIYPKYDLLEITPLIIASNSDTTIEKVVIIDESGNVLLKIFPKKNFVMIKTNLPKGIYTIDIQVKKKLPNKIIDVQIPKSKFCIHEINSNLKSLIDKIKKTDDCLEKLKLSAMLYEYLTESSEGLEDYTYGRDLALFLIKLLKRGTYKCSDLYGLP